MADHNYQAQIKRLGIPDKYVEHGTQAELWRECDYDTQAIVETLYNKLLASRKWLLQHNTPIKQIKKRALRLFS